MTDSLATTVDDLKRDRWIDHLTDLFDRQLRCGWKLPGTSQATAIDDRPATVESNE